MMKKKIIITLVLSVLAMLILCAAAFAVDYCSICEENGKTGICIPTFSAEFGCGFKCDNCGASGSAMHEHGVTCEVCDATFNCNFSQWTTNGNGTHTRECISNRCSKSETADCTGGTATCMELAVCKDCEGYYGEVSTTNHGEFTEWAGYNSEYHYRYCTLCGDPDTYEYESHTGGTATCISFATCDVCGDEYGDVSTTNHGEFTEWAGYDSKYHYRYCKDCARPETYEYEKHTGGTATCTDYPICDVCKSEYGELDFDNHDLESTRIEGTETHKTVCLYGCSYDEIEDCFGGKATCVSPAVCAGCGETYGEADSENGHEYKKKVVEGTCTSKGYIEYACKYCGDSYTEPAKTANLHWFDLWTSNGDGTHSAACKRVGCDHISNNKCESYEVTIGENTYSVCPVCGDGVFEVVEGALIEGEKLPKGEAIIRGAANPFEGALYAFTAGYEYSGDMEAFTEAVKVSLPVSVEGEFKLMLAGEEALTEIAYTVEEGILSFETETAGLFIIVPVVEEAA